MIERRLDGKLKRQSVTAGDFFIIPSNTTHRIHTEGKQGLIFLRLDPDFVKKVAYDISPSYTIALVPHFDRSDSFIYQMAIALKEMLKEGEICSHFYIDTSSAGLADHLLKNNSTLSPTEEKASVNIQAVESAIDYTNAHIAKPLSLRIGNQIS